MGGKLRLFVKRISCSAVRDRIARGTMTVDKKSAEEDDCMSALPNDPELMLQLAPKLEET